MKRLKGAAVWSVCAALTLTACGGDTRQAAGEQPADKPAAEAQGQTEDRQEPDDESVKQESVSQNAVMMVYMVGSNLESEGGMASLDIMEIAGSGFDEENMDVLICTGGASQWWIDGIPSDECTVFEVTDGTINPVYTLSNKNMADAATLREFINYGYMNYDAGYYDLVLWNHGGGAVLGYGADENYDYDTLSVAEINDALKGTKLVAEGEKFEWIGFDACLMGMLEVADMTADYADYLIASEEVEAGAGWDYGCLKTLSDGKHFEGEEAADVIITAYSKFYEEQQQYTPDYTLSCLDLSKTDVVVESLEQFVNTAAVELQDGGYSKIARMRDRTKTFGKVSQDSFYDTVDLYDLADKMMHLYPEEAEQVQSAVQEMVVCQRSNVRDAHGVAVYFPYSNKEYAQMFMAAYSEIGFSETYTSFLTSFSDTLSGAQLAQWDIAEAEPVESEETVGEYYVQLSGEQTANFGHAKYSVWEQDGEDDETYICWMDSSDVNLSDDGVLSADFDGKQFFLSDASGELHVCCATELERNEEYAKYAIPIIIERQTEETDGIPHFDYRNAYIHVKVDEEHPDGIIIGVYESMNTDSSLFPDKQVIELQEGDSIMPFIFARNIVFREDGSVAPFEEWEVSSGTIEYFLLEGELTVTMQDTEPGTKYCFLFNVHDTQGNLYMTNPIYIEY